MKRRKFITITLPLALAGVSRAAESEQPGMVFGVIADPQYADVEPAGSRFYRNSLEKLERTIEEFNGKDLAFVTTLGDLIDRDFKSFEDVMPLYAKLKAPHYPVLGNHDFSVADADKEKVIAAVGLKEPYYSRQMMGWRLIFLDGTDVSRYRYPSGDPRSKRAAGLQKALQDTRYGRFPNYSGAVGEEQMKWFRGELDEAKREKQRVIVFNHFPLLPAGDGYNLWNAQELTELMAGYDHIAVYMNGHNHKGHYGSQGGMHFVNFKGMVETESKTAYAVVRCFSDRLEIEGYGQEPDRKLSKI